MMEAIVVIAGITGFRQTGPFRIAFCADAAKTRKMGTG
jgi:hypothetical protein